MPPANDDADPDLSIVAPAHNEQDNLEPLIAEIERAMTGWAAGSGAGTRPTYEVIIVDDGSTDQTGAVLRRLMAARPWLRAVTMADTPPGRGHGQSAAFAAGFRASRGRLIASLDADLQNDPADIPRLVAILRSTGAGMAQGDRSAARKDGLVRRAGSAVGRFARRLLLGDTVKDTGCSLRVMARDLALRLPLEYRGMHRFIPVLARDLGYTVVETPVSHRPRRAGATKYGAGLARAIPGLIDCFAVRYMRRRRRPTAAREVRP